uniref:Uncharacterized protein n=1 Tax=Tanacetum cinerariifolium TaxID=118510 RepID=A0A6L2K4M6_TANCI|nr:hypothetical protein [Tanacetum cinerariifolium]
MVAILEKSEHNVDFHPMVDFIEASPLRSVTESSLRRNLKLKDETGISSLSDTELFENLTLMEYNISPNQKFTFQKGQFSHQWKKYTRRARIAQSSALSTVADEPDSPLRDVDNVHVPSQQKLDLLFSPLYDEFFNAGSNPQDKQPTTNIQSTPTPSTPTYVHAEENNNNQAKEEHLPDDEFTNLFFAPAQEVAESSSYNIGN